MKQLLISLPLIIGGVSCSDANVENDNKEEGAILTMNLSGTIDNEEVKWIYLKQFDGEKWIVSDSAKITDHTFDFEMYLEAPQMIYLKYEEEVSIPVFAENSEIKIHINDVDSVLNIEGSKSHQEWLDLEAELNFFETSLDSLYGVYHDVQELNDPIRLKEIETEYDLIDQQKTIFINDYIKSNPDSYISAYLFSNEYYYSSDMAELETLLALFDENKLESKHLNAIRARIKDLEKTAVGTIISEFELPDSEGNIVNIKDFEGQYVLIDFWASWCGPCRQENPNVVNAFKKYKSHNFTILGVSLDKDKEKWLNAIKKDNLTWTHISDLNGWENKVSQHFGVKSIPFSILINPEGKILAKNLRGGELHNFLNNELIK
jgi:peroxiredoxin